MKKTKIGILKGLLLAGALVFAGCQGVLDDATQSQGDGATGTVQVQIGSPADARTLAPTTGIAKYRLGYAKAADGPFVYKDLAATATETLKLEPGTWYFSAIGYTSDDGDKKDRAVAKGTTPEPGIRVSAGEAVKVNILLSEAGDVNVPGYFKYDVDWSKIDTSYGGTTDVSLTLTPLNKIGFDNSGTVIRDLRVGNYPLTSGTNPDTNGEVMTAHGTHTTGKFPLPSGVYEMDITVSPKGSASMIKNEDTTIHRKETVYIYSYLETLAQYTFTELDVAKVYLSGSRPRWYNATAPLYGTGASYLEVYKEKNLGTPLTFSRSNGTGVTGDLQTRWSFSSDTAWQLYLPGYQISDNVTAIGTGASNSVWIYARWNWVGGNYSEMWFQVFIDDKHRKEDIAIVGRERDIYADYNSSAVSGGNPTVAVNGGTFASSTAGYRSASPGDPVQMMISTQLTAVSSVDIYERRSIHGAPAVEELVTHYLVGGETETGTVRKTSSYGWTLDFAMPEMSGGDPLASTDYEVDPNDTRLIVRVHCIIPGDTITPADIRKNINDLSLDLPEATYYIASYGSRVTSIPETYDIGTSFGASQPYAIVKWTDEIGGTSGLYTRSELVNLNSVAAFDWYVPGIHLLADIDYNLYSKTDLNFVDGNYWSSERANATYAYRGLYRVFHSAVRTNILSLNPSTASPGVDSDSRPGTPFNNYYTGASSLTSNFYKIAADDGSTTARVRFARTFTWTK